jgi:hypothetical protein
MMYQSSGKLMMYQSSSKVMMYQSSKSKLMSIRHSLRECRSTALSHSGA